MMIVITFLLLLAAAGKLCFATAHVHAFLLGSFNTNHSRAWHAQLLC
jgi:hypothetical protein